MKKFITCARQMLVAKKDGNEWLPLVSIKIISVVQIFKKDDGADTKTPIITGEDLVCDEITTDIVGLDVLIKNLQDIKKEFETDIEKMTPKGEKKDDKKR